MVTFERPHKNQTVMHKDLEEQQLLDHFAGLAMQGILSSQQDMRGNGGSYGNHYSPIPLADECYDIAKAMLKARKEVLKDG